MLSSAPQCVCTLTHSSLVFLMGFILHETAPHTDHASCVVQYSVSFLVFEGVIRFSHPPAPQTILVSALCIAIRHDSHASCMRMGCTQPLLAGYLGV